MAMIANTLKMVFIVLLLVFGVSVGLRLTNQADLA
nr:MAG TPA: Protein of unknown function (DUF3679) [Caudoviricetes sp.]